MHDRIETKNKVSDKYRVRGGVTPRIRSTSQVISTDIFGLLYLVGST